MKSGPRPINMSGEVYNRLTGVSYQGNGRWLFDCLCGDTTIANGSDVRRGKVRSCGCLLREVAKSGNSRRTHGASGTPEMNSFASMHQRCYDDTRLEYHNYGGRGIKVCKRWHNFDNFKADMGRRPAGMTLDRIDVNGDYEPNNCRWATKSVQSNNRRTNVMLTAHGITKSLTEWARECGVTPQTIKYRISRGLSVEDAVTMPKNQHKRYSDRHQTVRKRYES